MAARRKIGLATAGRRVAALAQSFSDDLLVDETKTFEAIDVQFAIPVPAMRKALREALAKADGKPSALKPGSPVGTLLRQRYAQSLRDADRHVEILCETAFAKALAAIRDELRVCESALAARFDGLADDACVAVEDSGADIRRVMMTRYREAVKGLPAEFLSAAGGQFREATDERTLLLRVLSPTPAGLRGFSGRGVWWRALSDVKASARALSIQTANAVRLEAMKQFNAGYDVLA